jgi:hypothetical protein
MLQITHVYITVDSEKNAADYSWWPKQHTWQNSGANVGYWSSMNEFFFQERLAGIRAGSVTPLTAHQWKDKLKYRRTDTVRMLKSVEGMTAAQL